MILSNSINEQEYLNNVGMGFRIERTRQRITMEKMAQLTKLCKKTIVRMESGNVEPNLLTMKRVADALGKPLSKFL